ncbi:hypothetical protein NJ959_09160 [Symplocastrum sp. BBK-W-15]|uniref:Aspartate/glutamate/uridylate kinase domain-containing protein n=1 Tax=Limnofasciculus baicalensis BBK-W-15 TaxID=2699891 RepID=A0AAE3KNG8_9CYAN|nr:hypothetical protein [Limnofasciculus baicalensis BBK-W-15]
MTLVKDVDGLFEEDPKLNPNANFISKISTAELRERNFDTLVFDRILIDLLDQSRLIREFQIVNGRQPERIAAALNGEHVGTIVYSERFKT